MIDLDSFSEITIEPRDDRLVAKISRNVHSHSDLEIAHQFLPRIYIAGDKVANNESYLFQLGITHVVNTAAVISIPSPFPLSFEYCNFFLQDIPSQPIDQVFPRALLWIQDALDADPKNKVLIHCRMGKSRSVTVAAAYALWAKDKYFTSSTTITADMVLAYFRSIREIILLNRRFLHTLRIWTEKLAFMKKVRNEYSFHPQPRAWALYHANIHDPMYHPIEKNFGDTISNTTSVLLYLPTQEGRFTEQLALLVAPNDDPRKIVEASEYVVRFELKNCSQWTWRYSKDELKRSVYFIGDEKHTQAVASWMYRFSFDLIEEQNQIDGIDLQMNKPRKTANIEKLWFRGIRSLRAMKNVQHHSQSSRKRSNISTYGNDGLDVVEQKC